jgi:propionyl-CoA synthetase
MVLNSNVDKLEEVVVSEVIQNVRNDIGAVAAFKLACVVSALPKTRSGKILRGNP